MATIYSISTPPPPGTIHTPTTPRLGWEDKHEPYSPRKPTRAQRSRATHTPPPQQSGHNLRSSDRSKSTNIHSSTPFSPPIATKQTPSSPAMMDRRRVSGALSYDSTTAAAESLGIASAGRGESERNQGMLPTPAKTPKKQSDNIPGISSIARNLFSVRGDGPDGVMPTPKKSGRKKFLDSFETEDEAPIHIYTDSHERIPEIDTNDNPFYGNSTTRTEPPKRMSKRRVTVPGEGRKTVEELQEREDGMVVVFRGKKMFRKFPQYEEPAGDDEDAEVDAELDQTVSSNLRKPLTRSSIKPRLLFPPKPTHTEEDEEAVTDIEEPINVTPKRQKNTSVSTPKAPKYAPVSPPTTARATRSKDVEMGNSPASQSSNDESQRSSGRGGKGSSGKISPFNYWQRTKNGASGHGKKREGEPLTRGGAESKRQRGH